MLFKVHLETTFVLPHTSQKKLIDRFLSKVFQTVRLNSNRFHELYEFLIESYMTSVDENNYSILKHSSIHHLLIYSIYLLIYSEIICDNIWLNYLYNSKTSDRKMKHLFKIF